MGHKVKKPEIKFVSKKVQKSKIQDHFRSSNFESSYNKVVSEFGFLDLFINKVETWFNLKMVVIKSRPLFWNFAVLGFSYWV